jgi:hypothetical protein
MPIWPALLVLSNISILKFIIHTYPFPFLLHESRYETVRENVTKRVSSTDPLAMLRKNSSL